MTFRIKPVYYLELVTPDTMKLLDSINTKTPKDKNGKNVPHSEITEVVPVPYNIVHNDYQHNLYSFVPNKLFGQLLDISSINSEFSFVEEWFTYLNFKLTAIKDKNDITLLMN